MSNNNPFLYFKFAQQDDSQQTLLFQNPTKIYIAKEIKEVIPCLKLINKEVSSGNYAAGYLSYESAPAFDNNLQVQVNNEMPLLWFGIFDKSITTDYSNHTFQPYSLTDWQPNVSLEEYYNNVTKIKNHIKNNQTKQVNYTIKLKSQFSGDSFAYYKQLDQVQSANYSAYLNIGEHSILSASPELFFHLKDNTILTKPMKGTIDRGKSYEEDIRNASLLQSSYKNRYENKLITDLMCNEIKKIAKKGTIKVKSKFDIEKYPTVYQMTSTVQAELAHHTNIIDIFKALFPCGSITGTPKQRTMDIIHKLEDQPREVYCGAIGYLTPDHEAIFNVPIRTVVISNQNGATKYGVGGAITINSDKTEEYHEVLTKAKLLTERRPSFKLLESFGLINGEYIVYENHLKRLKQSANYFDYNINMHAIKKDLAFIAKKHQKDTWKIRLTVDKFGHHLITAEQMSQHPDEVNVTLADKPIAKNELFLYHKTTYRDIYKEHQKEDEKVFDVLLWNENNEVTEFTMGNLVAEIDGILFTPPIECGLLPGTYREMLLHKKKVKERKITIEELKNCPKIWFINSVRRWIPVNLVM